VREVRDVRPEGLVFDRDGASETIPWRDVKSDPEWWTQLFYARLDRDWTPAEARDVVGLLRIAGATRGAELAREGIDPRSRGTLAPAELEELGKVFEPALTWIDLADPAGKETELRAALERERRTAQRLRDALQASQARTWAVAVAHLETLLAGADASLLVGVLSDGADWSAAPPLPVVSAAPPSNGPGEDPDAPGKASGDATGEKDDDGQR
jgi:hypothetical protein